MFTLGFIGLCRRKMSVRVSVCPSVRLLHAGILSIGYKHIIGFFQPLDSYTILVFFRTKRFSNILVETP